MHQIKLQWVNIIAANIAWMNWQQQANDIYLFLFQIESFLNIKVDLKCIHIKEFLWGRKLCQFCE